MKRLVSFLLLLALAPAWASQTKITDWWATYHVTKDDSQVTEFWNRTVARGALKISPQMRERLIGFFGAVFREKPELLKANIKSIPKDAGIEQDGIVLILWLTDHDYSRSLLRDAGFSKVAETPVPAIKNRRIYREEDADFLHGWYNATGNTEALSPMVRLIKETDWSQENEKANHAGYAAAIVVEICGRDSNAQQYIREMAAQTDLSEGARTIFEQALKEPHEPVSSK